MTPLELEVLLLDVLLDEEELLEEEELFDEEEPLEELPCPPQPCINSTKTSR
jgi:hypothetical protein